MRIASLAPSTTEILLALGGGEELCAVTAFCKLPPEFKALRRLPGWSTLKAAEVLECKPDLILTSTVCQDALREELGKSGAAVLHLDPRSLDEVALSFQSLGQRIGRGSAGEALTATFRRDLETWSLPEPLRRPRLYVEEWHEPPMVAGNWVPELVLRAGAEPFNRKLGQLSQAVSWEEVMEFDPDWVLYSICGVGLHFDPGKFLEVEGWKGLSAARQRHIFSVDDSLFNVPGPGLVEGLKLLRSLLGGKPPSSLRGLAAPQAIVRNS